LVVGDRPDADLASDPLGQRRDGAPSIRLSRIRSLKSQRLHLDEKRLASPCGRYHRAEAATYDEFVDISQHVDYLIERNRIMPGETKCEILARVLGDSDSADPDDTPKGLDLGEGVRLGIGEKLYLFLYKKQNKEDATAEVKEDGIYMDGQKIFLSKGSFIQSAMQIVQKRLNHRNQDGQLVSLSARGSGTWSEMES
jgi:hypothetical protein